MGGNRVSHVEPLAVSVSEAAVMLGISRPKVYDLMRSEKFYPAFKVGNRTLISVDGLREWIKEQTGREVSA